MSSQPDQPLPTTGRDRHVALDVLRGVAILGILPVNIVYFGGLLGEAIDPTTLAREQGLSLLVYGLMKLAFEFKFITLFSLMFGAGVALIAPKGPAVFYRRVSGLLLIGIVHAYGIWYGDILVTYALCGAVAFLFARLGVGWQIGVGAALLAVGWALSTGLSSLAWLFAAIEPAEADQVLRHFTSPEVMAFELEAYRGGYVDALTHRAGTSTSFLVFVFPLFLFWRTTGLMLLGMALVRLKVLTGLRSSRFYLIGGAVGLALGLPLTIGELALAFSSPDHVWAVKAVVAGSTYVSSLLLACAWMCLVIFAARALPGGVTAPLAAVGRTALTNYLAQSVICTTLFYGHGLGLFGHLSYAAYVPIVLGIWGLQLTLSPLWLRRFRFGPVEWLWRAWAYWRWPALRQACPEPVRVSG